MIYRGLIRDPCSLEAAKFGPALELCMGRPVLDSHALSPVSSNDLMKPEVHRAATLCRTKWPLPDRHPRFPLKDHLT